MKQGIKPADVPGWNEISKKAAAVVRTNEKFAQKTFKELSEEERDELFQLMAEQLGFIKR